MTNTKKPTEPAAVCPDSVTKTDIDNSLPDLGLVYRPRLNTHPLEWLLSHSGEPSFADRVLARLIQSEAHEPNLWLKDDCRQSFITICLALKGETQPFVSASYRMYGLHPDKLYPAILARRKALLGPNGVNEIAQNSLHSPCGVERVGDAVISIPKKPPDSVPRKRKDKTA